MASSDHARPDPQVVARHYKVCCGCGTLVAKKRGHCGACNAYRFEEGSAAVKSILDERYGPEKNV